MTERSRSLRLFAVLASTAALALCAPARAESLNARYSVSIIGLTVGSATVTAELGPSSYSLQADTKLTGVAGAVTRSQGGAKASGAIAGGRLMPATYATTASNSDTTRTVRMAMTGGGVRGVDISPPFDDHPDRVPVSDQHRRGVIDPLSAIVMPVAEGEAMIGPGACNRVLPVFDGHTRFDVKLAYVGKRKVDVPGYSGEVAVCNARYIPIAGHRPNRPATKFMAENKHLEAWLAPVGSSRIAVPFRIAVRSMIGTVVIEAQEFNVSGGTRASLGQ